MLSEDDLSDTFPRFVLNDVTPLSLGIEVAGDVMSTIVQRNSTIPTKKSGNYTTTVDNQEIIDVKILEGERSMTIDNNLLGEFKLRDIPPMPAGKASVDVTFDIDANGILNVSATEETTGNKNKITITNDAGHLSKEDIERMVATAEFYKSEDETNRYRAVSKFKLETYCYEIKKKISSGKITSSVMKELDDAITKALEFSSANPTADAREYEKELKDLKVVTQRLLPK